MTTHTIQTGDTVDSIAFAHGYAPDWLWQHALNANLRKKRQDRNQLVPGDQIRIPPRDDSKHNAATGQRHRYRRHGVPARLRVQLFDSDQPRAGQSYTLYFNDEAIAGATDQQGLLEQTIPPDLQQARLVIGPEQTEYCFKLGHLQPVSELTGVQQRLNNLGFYCGDSGTLDEATTVALYQFQYRAGLEVTGTLDDATSDALARYHDTPSALPAPTDAA